MTKNRQPPERISDHVIQLCAGSDSVSSLLAEDPSLAPGDAWKKLFRGHALKDAKRDAREEDSGSGNAAFPQDELSRAARCGRWGPTKPGELFLTIYHDALCTLGQDTLKAMVSPSLMGSYGTVPLTIISVLPDIVRHMSNVIVQAEREVFLATNYWENTVASKYITNAIRELDRRAGVRGTKIVLKILYDRGAPRQLYEPHYIVPEKEYTSDKVNLPHPGEIPNINMQVMNFHTPLMGTFHAKYMIVDRKVALLQSNNIQDNDNLEMLIHLEGPIVDSLYDMALISWHKKLDPPLPCLDSPAARDGSHPENLHTLVQQQARPTPPPSETLPAHTADDPHYDDDIAGEVARINASLAPRPGQSHLQAVTRLLNHTVNEGFQGDPDAPECPPGEFMTPYIPHQSQNPYPMALVNRAPYGPPTHRSISTPQNAAWLSALRNAKQSVYIVSPTLNASPLIPAIIEACERGVDVHCWICLSYNDAGELLPGQGGHNEMTAHTLHTALSPAAKQHLHWHWYVAKDQTRPISQSRRLRSSHIKLMVVDGRIGIQGNGNQDTQSWFHSQEVNLMVDSESICAEWLRGLDRNQNTRLFGAVRREDGVWRDERGEEVEGAMGVGVNRVKGLVKGVKGAVERVRGTGGF
ncbi:hypothetical protein VTI74DRAFT_8860 [Chaetomium olivicolor]